MWANTEELWEGIFSLIGTLLREPPLQIADNGPVSIACIIIYVMGLTFLKMDQSRVKWRIKLSEAFAHRAGKALFSFGGNKEDGEPDRPLTEEELAEEQAMKKKARSGKYAIFFLPFITVIREGLEAIVFVGGVSWDRLLPTAFGVLRASDVEFVPQVSLGQDGASIPIAAIVGLIAGIFVGKLNMFIVSLLRGSSIDKVGVSTALALLWPFTGSWLFLLASCSSLVRDYSA